MIFEKIFKKENLEQAWKHVRASRSVPGIDRVTIEDYEKNIEYHLTMLRNQLRDGQYQPLPVITFRNKSHNGKDGRVIGISTVRDRVVQLGIWDWEFGNLGQANYS